MAIMGLRKLALVLVLATLLSLQTVFGLQIMIDKEECFTLDVKYEGDTIRASFVVVKSNYRWNSGQGTVDLVVKGPHGEQIQDFRDTMSEKFNFVALQRGVHRFCFTNKSPHFESLDIDIREDHFSFSEEKAKDEHFEPLKEQLSKLNSAIFNIHFEQHWMEAELERQAEVNNAMSKRAIYKACFESAAMVGASVLQIYLLQRLFNKKLGVAVV